MNLALVAPSALGSAPLAALQSQIKTLPHYGVHYVERTLADARPGAKERWTAWLERGTPEALNLSMGADVTLPRIPKPIEGIPDNISLGHMKASTTSTSRHSMADRLFGSTPVNIQIDLSHKPGFAKLSSHRDIWYRQGWMSKSPTVTLAVALRPRQLNIEVTAVDSIRLALYDRLLNEAIGPKLVDLTAAGSTYRISVEPSGIYFSFSGYEEALPHLISEVLKAFNGFNAANATPSARFTRIVRDLRQELQTFSDMPVSYAQGDLARLLRAGEHSRSESLAALDSTEDGGGLFATRAVGELLLSKPLEITALAMGNLQEAAAKEALSKIAGSVATAWQEVSAPGQVQRVARIVNPFVPVEIRALNPRPGDGNDVAIVSLIHGVADVESRVIFGIVSSLLATAAFDELRTLRQLGYVVSAGVAFISNILYVTGLVQGTKLRADDAEAAIEGLFTNTMPKLLRNMTNAAFLAQVDAFRQQILEPPLGTSGEMSHFWEHIREGGDCLHQLDSALHFLDSPRLTRNVLAEAWDSLIFGGSKGSRKKVSVKYFADLRNDQAKATASPVPRRPSLEEARDIWTAQGVAPKALEMLANEYAMAKVVDKADSKVRKDLATEYFSNKLLCHATDSSSSKTSFLHMQGGTKHRRL